MHAHSQKPPGFRQDFSRRWALVAFNLIAAVALAACGGGGGGGNGQQQQNNTAPTVSAGPDQTITLPATATLSGSATDAQGQTLTYLWSGPSGVTFASATSASTTATFSAAGTYALTLTANDGTLSGTDTLTVTVQAAANTAPTVNAGADQTITLPATASLAGSATDAEGNTLTYAWASDPSAGVSFADASAAATTATFTTPGTYTLTLTANDGTTTGSDSLTVTVQAAGGVNTPPTVSAGVDHAITLPTNSVQLTGTASDAENNALTFAWTSSPATVTFSDAAALVTTATFPAEGSYTLTLTVSDGVASASDTATVVVQAAGSGAFYPAPDTDETDPDRGWTRVDPASVGMDATRLAQAATYAQTGPGGAPLAGEGMVIKDGRLVHSWGSNIDTRRASQSATKSIGGIALAFALEEGLLQMNGRAIDSLPSLGNPPGTDDPARLELITIEQLATHSSGFPKDGGFHELLFEPGTRWSYSDGGLNWLADALTNEFSEDLHALMTRRVWANLGLNGGVVTNTDDILWRVATSGKRPRTPAPAIEHRELASGISINANAMARVGLMFLREGMWSTGRILPESFIDLVRTPPASIAGLPINEEADYPGATANYGVLWWTNTTGQLPDVPRDAFWAWGQGDSLIVVIPSLQLVISRIGAIPPGVSTSREWGESDWNADYAILEGFLNPIVCAADATSTACNP